MGKSSRARISHKRYGEHLSKGGDQPIKNLMRSVGPVLLSLLVLSSFAQAHLISGPFRATDTDLSGGDHICDLRRDSNNDGRPDRLGDHISVCGTVIAEPSTFEKGQLLFWIRSDGCGILVYGKREHLDLGDSVQVWGTLRLTRGNLVFPETGFATQGDVAVKNEGIVRISTSCSHNPIDVLPEDFSSYPERYGGNLITVQGLSVGSMPFSQDGDVFMKLTAGPDTINLYLDADTGCSIDNKTNLLTVTGIVVRMRVPDGFARSPAWCIAPRRPSDLIGQSQSTEEITWGGLKILFNQPPLGPVR